MALIQGFGMDGASWRGLQTVFKSNSGNHLVLGHVESPVFCDTSLHVRGQRCDRSFSFQKDTTLIEVNNGQMTSPGFRFSGWTGGGSEAEQTLAAQITDILLHKPPANFQETQAPDGTYVYGRHRFDEGRALKQVVLESRGGAYHIGLEEVHYYTHFFQDERDAFFIYRSPIYGRHYQFLPPSLRRFFNTLAKLSEDETAHSQHCSLPFFMEVCHHRDRLIASL